MGGVTLRGRPEILRFLRARFERQLESHLALSLFCSDASRVAAHALLEWRSPAAESSAASSDGGWWRTRCNDFLQFADDGTILAHDSATNDVPIAEEERALRDSAAAFAQLAERHGLLPRPAGSGAADVGANGNA